LPSNTPTPEALLRIFARQFDLTAFILRPVPIQHLQNST
jgi:hypothetical protein